MTYSPALRMASRSSFFIGIKTAVTASAFSGSRISSSNILGTTCQVTPNLSVHQPHCSASGTAESFSQKKSISS